MKHRRIAIARMLLALSLTLLLFPAAAGRAEESVSASLPDPWPLSIHREEAWGAVDDLAGEMESRNFVFYPVLETEDESLAPAVERINRSIQEKARIPEYLQLLSTLQPGGAGLKMDYDIGLASSWTEGEGPRIYDWVLSLLFCAEGKMLSGRPSQIYYPMTFDLRTGEEIAFDQLFADPDGAKTHIEAELEENVEPILSTYLENSQLFPVPFDRFFLDSWGHVILVYDNSQLSFLSGTSGAVSFRYSELKDYLDLTPDGIISHLPWKGHMGRMTKEERGQAVWSMLRLNMMIPSSRLLALGTGMDIVWHGYSPQDHHFHPLTDSDFYPGGAYYEVEEPEFRGALILTDENGETVHGILADHVDLYDLETGKTLLPDAEAFLGREPETRVQIDESTAEYYRVCAGTASVYRLESHDGKMLSFTLYADENGVVQYVKLALEND